VKKGPGSSTSGVFSANGGGAGVGAPQDDHQMTQKQELQTILILVISSKQHIQ
jgi:hypothetical protein